MNVEIHDPLRRFLRSIEGRTGIGRRDTFANEAIETGGEYRPAPIATHPDAFLIQLHNIRAHCVSGEAGAIATWIVRARAAVGEVMS
ncbi:hypothetical protein [Pseudooceanicola sp.]|uniref:hypothetical protein n=1 Tax=Pseudooceanicola sp. TaxID=1914328 RepID=UPI00405A4034